MRTERQSRYPGLRLRQEKGEFAKGVQLGRRRRRQGDQVGQRYEGGEKHFVGGSTAASHMHLKFVVVVATRTTQWRRKVGGRKPRSANGH